MTKKDHVLRTDGESIRFHERCVSSWYGRTGLWHSPPLSLPSQPDPQESESPKGDFPGKVTNLVGWIESPTYYTATLHPSFEETVVIEQSTGLRYPCPRAEKVRPKGTSMSMRRESARLFLTSCRTFSVLVRGDPCSFSGPVRLFGVPCSQCRRRIPGQELDLNKKVDVCFRISSR